MTNENGDTKTVPWNSEEGRTRTRWAARIIHTDYNPLVGCSALHVLLSLKKQGKLRRFEDIHGLPSPDGFGDCQEVTDSLMRDLICAGRGSEWSWACGWIPLGRGPSRFEHCWIEFDGWVLDAANGKLHFWNADLWLRLNQPTRLVKRTARQFKRHVNARARKYELRPARIKSDADVRAQKASVATGFTVRFHLLNTL
jgi:hypothetical protein